MFTTAKQLTKLGVKAGTHEGACSCNTLPQHAPGAKLPRLYQWFHAKKLLRNKIFALGFCSIESNWLNMREQAPGANLLWERVAGASSLVCIGLKPWRFTLLLLPWSFVAMKQLSRSGVNLLRFIAAMMRMAYYNYLDDMKVYYNPFGVYIYIYAERI